MAELPQIIVNNNRKESTDDSEFVDVVKELEDYQTVKFTKYVHKQLTEKLFPEFLKSLADGFSKGADLKKL